MNIKMKIVSFKSHHLIKKIERYHDLFRRVYAIIVSKISDIDSNSTLQMTFKALNDLTDFNDLVSTLFVFNTYFRIIEMNISFLTITQRSITMRKIMKKVRKTIAFCQVNDA